MFLLRCLWSFLYSHATQIKDLHGPSGAHHGKGQRLQTYNLKAFNPFFYLAETPGTGLASHIHLHAVLAKWRVKHTANVIYVIMTHLKI